MAYEKPIITDARGNVVRFAHPALPEFPSTTAAAITAGATSMTVADNAGFSNGQWIVIGQPKQAKAELVSITSPIVNGTSISMQAAVYDHPQDTPVQLSMWNGFYLYGAATPTGSKTFITVSPIRWAMPDNEVIIASGSTWSYYFVRFYDTTTGYFSDYSDAAPADGYAADTVRAVKTTALNLTGEQVDGIITDDFLDTEITNCEIDIWKQKRRWAQFYVDHYVLGALTAGQVDYAMPTDISDPNTNEAIRSVRVRQVGMLEYVDVEAIEGLLWDTAVTTLAVTTSVGATSITLTSDADFGDDGSILLGSDSVTYTARNTTTNVLSGIPASGTGSITVAWPATTTYVWQGGNVETSPTVYTVKPGYINTILPPSLTYTGQALYLSYYAKPTYPDSDTDLIEWPDPELYHFYLAWKIDLRRHNGTPTEAGMNFKQLYDARRELLLSRARLQDTPKFMPARRFSRQQMGSLPSDNIVSWIIR